MSRKLKEMMVAEMTDRFAGLEKNGCIVVSFRSLSAQNSANVRAILEERGAHMTVVRNRLFAVALKGLGMAELGEALDGPSAIVTGQDAVAAAKAAEEASKSAPGLELAGGFAEGRVLTAQAVAKLASLPSREVLLSQVLTCMVSPAQRLVNGLSLTIQRVACVLDQLRATKQAGSDPDA